MKLDRCLIIAEAGVNHNGDVDTALRLCDSAKNSGADVIKFQTWKTESLITQKVDKAEYQVHNSGGHESQYEMLKRLELSYADFARIKRYCDDIGIVFASTADDPQSLDFLCDLGIPFIKVGSGDIGNIPFLRYIGNKKKPIILSTGMSSLRDIDLSIDALKEGGGDDIILLHCTTSYPCLYEDVNLNAMITIRDAFHLDVGYSDHTRGNMVALAAVALGARVIEKHFTLNREMTGPDHLSSVEPHEFKKLVDGIRIVESSLGSGIKRPSRGEERISEVVLKRIVAQKKISAGDVFTSENICTKRCESGLPASNWDYVIGSKSLKSYDVDEGISFK